MKRYRVHGHTEIEVTTIIEVEDDEELDEENICARAAEQFEGIQNYAGMGDFYHLIGVSGEEDTIDAPNSVEFDDFEEED